MGFKMNTHIGAIHAKTEGTKAHAKAKAEAHAIAQAKGNIQGVSNPLNLGSPLKDRNSDAKKANERKQVENVGDDFFSNPNEVESDNKMRIQMKYFEIANTKQDIFKCCDKLLCHINDPSYEYETDGLIFTPGNLGIPIRNYKITWEHSFKWKPPQFNSIDFLVKFKKNDKNEDEVNTWYSEGMDLSSATNSNMYKTLILMCGFSQGNNGHGYMNPCQMVLEDDIPSETKNNNKFIKNIYEPMPFYPTTPYDPEASICNLFLKKDSNDEYQLFTENNEIIEDNTIVEFSYDCTEQKNLWRFRL